MPRTASRLLAILALGLALAGCDKCGDLFGVAKDNPQSCRATPAQR